MTTQAQILVVDDDIEIRKLVARYMQEQGLRVLLASKCAEVHEKIATNQVDLIVLDVMLPGLDGFEVCRILRQETSIPVLMLTARDDEIDRVVGLEVGADDYLAKPFSMRELMARVKALLRRVRLIREDVATEKQEEVQTKLIAFDNLVIDLTRREVKLYGEVLALKPREYELLLFMGQQKGRLLTRPQILEQVWGWDYMGDSRTVDVHVCWLRKKIEPDPETPQRIITARGAGYRFEG